MMHKNLLLVVVFSLGVGLYLLPTRILTNEDKSAPMANRDKNAEVPTLPSETKKQETEHAEEKSSEVIALEANLAEAKEIKVKTQLLDSLITLQLSQAKFSSAANYARQKAEFTGSNDDKLVAGELFAEAAGFAVDEENQRQLAEKAELILQEILTENPKNTRAKIALAEVYVMGSNPMEGIFLLREILQEDPTNKAALYQMGILSIQSGQYDKAASRLEQYTNIYSQDPEGWFYLGLAYKELKMNQKARRSLEKVKELDNDPEIWAAVDNYLKEL